MRLFIDKSGKVSTIDAADHARHCKDNKTTLKKFIKSNIRVKVFKGVLAVETMQKTINAGQLRAIRKLYREYNCFDFVGSINRVYVDNIRKLKI